MLFLLNNSLKSSLTKYEQETLLLSKGEAIPLQASERYELNS